MDQKVFCSVLTNRTDEGQKSNHFHACIIHFRSQITCSQTKLIWCLYYKTSRVRNLWKIDRFRSKLVCFLSSVIFTGLVKRTSLLRTPYIMSPYFFFFVKDPDILRLIYTSDFRGLYCIKLVHFQNKIVFLFIKSGLSNTRVNKP